MNIIRMNINVGEPYHRITFIKLSGDGLCRPRYVGPVILAQLLFLDLLLADHLQREPIDSFDHREQPIPSLWAKVLVKLQTS